MYHLMNVDLILLQAARCADRQHLFDQRLDSAGAIEDDLAVLADALVVGMTGGEEFSGAFDTGERVFDLMCEASRRKPQLRRPLNRVLGALLMREVVQEHNRAGNMPVGARQGGNLGPDRHRSRPDVEHGVGVTEVLAGVEAGMEHSGQPIVVSYDAAEQGTSELRHSEHGLGGGVNGDRFQVAVDYDNCIGQTVEDVPPQIADGFSGGANGSRHTRKSIIPPSVLK